MFAIRRRLLKLAALVPVAVATAFLSVAPAQAETYKFVRIDGLAEQAVAEMMLKEIYSRAGIDMTITPMPGKRALAQASSGKMDGETARVYGLGEKVTSLIRVPTPYSSLQTVAFARSGSGVAIAGRDDLNKYSSIIVTGVLHTHAITEGVRNVNEVREPSKMFEMVRKGRADIALTSYLDGQASLTRLGVSDLAAVEPSLKDQPLYHYVHESKQDIVPVIDAVIREMVASGELATLRAKLEKEYISSI